MLKRKQLKCDLCIVGGGMAGMAAAISAAREGIHVVLMHERPVLGGNASSEIRMWICGAWGENNRETGILEEIALENLYRNPTKSYAVWDTVLYDFVRREANITLLLNCTCMDCKTKEGFFSHGRTRKIVSISGYQMTTQCFYDIEADLFCDCSGDSILAPLSGAEFRLGREAHSEFKEDTATESADTMTMGMTCMMQGRETTEAIKFTPPEWSTKLTEEEAAGRKPSFQRNFWYLELGGDRDTIADTEELRDELIPLALGMWDYIKNSGKLDADKWELDFLGFLPGKRESRRMCGEYMITQRDISDGKVFEDEVAFGGWPLDDHFPGGFYHRGTPNTHYPTPAPYSLPYRALYSANVENLFFAGRNISMTHMAMSSIRVMATCALLGEAVGKAAAIATRYGCTPHDVYCEHIDQLQELLLNEDCFLPSRFREISEDCKKATLLGGSEDLRDGRDRVHTIYQTEGETYGAWVTIGDEVVYQMEAKKISSVHIVFDSDLNRETLPGSDNDRKYSTYANRSLSMPQMHMPSTLCKEFRLIGRRNGVSYELINVLNNRKRSYHVEVNKVLDELVLIPIDNWGDEDKIHIISFDFQ